MPIPVLVILIVLGVILLFGVLPFFIVLYVIFMEAYYNTVKEDNATSKFLTGPQYDPYKEAAAKNIEESRSIEGTEMRTTSYDGKTKLYGKYYRFNDTNKVQIYFHGYHGSGRRDMNGALMSIRNSGYNAIMVDQRSHGKSDGRIVTFGIRERKDVKVWVEEAKKLFGEDCIVVIRGLSLGATTVLMSLDTELQSNVKGVIADCPFSAPIDELVKVACESKTKMPPKAASFMMVTAAKVYGHFNVLESAPVTAVVGSKIPILLLHGTDDRFVPYDFSCKIAKANPEMIQFESFENAGHALCQLMYPERYQQVVDEFLRTNIN